MNGSHAPHACQTCRKQKRRCTKELPKCSLCIRLSRQCNYSDPCPPPSDNLHALHARIAELEAALTQPAMQVATVSNCSRPPAFAQLARKVNTNPLRSFPSIFFLDYKLFKEDRMTIVHQEVPIPDEIYSILRDITHIRTIADRYFRCTHTWFPILGRKRFELMLDDDNFVPEPDLALLLASMFLLNDEASNCMVTTRTSTYWSIKHFYSILEANGVITPQLLQANLLVTLYEIGHAVYPAAYISLGRCATIGKAIGLDNRENAPQMLRRYGSWAKSEELRRLWWAVVLLDRYVHLSLPGHAPATEDMPGRAILPADDHQFDIAEMVGSEPLYMTSPTNLSAGPFTRACQAAHLMGKTIDVLNDLQRGVDTRFISAIQVFNTLSAFSKVVRKDFDSAPEKYATPMALVYSAWINLADPFCCADSNKGSNTFEETELQMMCITGIKTISNDILDFANKLWPSMTSSILAISPLISHCLYMATTTFCWRAFEAERDEALESYRVARSVLSHLNARWAVSGEYLSAIDKARELHYSSPRLRAIN